MQLENTKKTSYSTDALPAAMQLPFWQESATPLFSDTSFQCEVDRGSGINGKVDHVANGDIRFFRFQASAHRVHRQKTQESSPAILIAWQLEGACRLRCRGQETVLLPGDFTVLYSDQKFDLEFDSYVRQIVMRAPVSILDDPLQILRRYSGRRLSSSGGAARVATSALGSFARQLPNLANNDARRVMRGVLDLVKAAAICDGPTGPLQHSTYASNLIARIHNYIDENLREDDLTSARIAAVHNISIRHLNKLFEDEPLPVSRLIWTNRLQRCRTDLLDSTMAAISVTEIAFSWGFKSASHFSRTFKQKFGITPTAMRSLHFMAPDASRVLQ